MSDVNVYLGYTEEVKKVTEQKSVIHTHTLFVLYNDRQRFHFVNIRKSNSQIDPAKDLNAFFCLRGLDLMKTFVKTDFRGTLISSVHLQRGMFGIFLFHQERF